MRYVQEDIDGNAIEVIDTEEIDLDGNEIEIMNADGYGSTDIYIQCGYITWRQLDILKRAIAEAEKWWRK